MGYFEGPAPAELNGTQLVAELAAAGVPDAVVSVNDGVLIVASPAITTAAIEATVAAVVTRHRPAPVVPAPDEAALNALKPKFDDWLAGRAQPSAGEMGKVLAALAKRATR